MPLYTENANNNLIDVGYLVCFSLRMVNNDTDLSGWQLRGDSFFAITFIGLCNYFNDCCGVT